MSNPKIIRSLKIDLAPNKIKIDAISDLLTKQRSCIADAAKVQWRNFHAGKPFDERYDATKKHRKAGVEVRSILLRQILKRFDLPESDSTKKRVPDLIPGVEDPMANWKENIGYSFQNMATRQAVSSLKSWFSSRQNDFRSVVYNSSVSFDLAHELYTVNKAEAWFDLKRRVHRKIDGKLVEVSIEARRLARKIMSHLFSKNRNPSFKNANLIIDQRMIAFEKSKTTTHFGGWLILNLKGRSKTNIPVVTNRYWENYPGKMQLTWAINKDRETGNFSATCFKNIAECIDHSVYKPEREELALDFGLNTLFASNEGDLWGRQFYKILKRYDQTITQITRHIQRSGSKPRDSKRYRQKVASLKSYVKCEINRILNRIITLKKPTVLILERLNFQNATLSRRLNRILQNCGRGVIKTKLASLEEQFGIEIIEVNPAYTSQECSSCHYIDKRNRKRESFQCRYCCTTIHSDVNGARNLPARRSCRATERGRKILITLQRRKDTLITLVRQFNERALPPGKRSRCSATPDDPRLNNPYFKVSLDVASLSDDKLRSQKAG